MANPVISMAQADGSGTGAVAANAGAVAARPNCAPERFGAPKTLVKTDAAVGLIRSAIAGFERSVI